MSTIALVVNGSREGVVEMAREVSEWLAPRGHGVRLTKSDAEAVGLDSLAVTAEELADGIDLAVALGGDGTMLRAVHLVADRRVPVLGVNLGRLAYLAALEPEGLCAGLERFLAGDYQLEERAMLTVSVEGEPDATHLALNEAVLEHAGAGHTVHVAVHIGGRFFTSHIADGLIVATPTGSTAYSFSAGGPIVSPRQRALMLTPVAPHTPFTRSLVLDDREPVRIEVLDYRGAILSIDGQVAGRLTQGDAITAAVASVPARFVTFGEKDFFEVLKAKFGLADR